tara:strand:+ start:2062 stop:2520 length:459 start_codon:yes stop_codon:yes gene_type:complete
MLSKVPPLINVEGHCAILFSQTAKSPKGSLHDGRGSYALPPTFTTFWAPKSLNIGNKMVLVTLENPSESGWNPQVRSVIYELITNEDKKLAADFVINQSSKLSLSKSKYGSRKNKTTYESQYVQLAFKDLNPYSNDEKGLEFNDGIVLDSEL